MDIIRRGGFDLRILSDGATYLIFDPFQSISEQIGFVKENKIFGLEINYFKKRPALEKFYDLEYFEGFNFVKGLSIGEQKFTANTLFLFKNLENLAFGSIRYKEIDFANFPMLKVVAFEWGKQIFNFNKCSLLEYITIDKYKKDDLNDLQGFKNIKMLRVYRSSITSINGIENSHKLDSLELYSCNQLLDIKAIKDKKNIVNIKFEYCKRIENIDALSQCENLERLILLDCGEIESLKPIAKLSKLNFINFYGNTMVMDGDLEPCVGKKANFIKRSNYNYTKKELDALIK